MQARSTRVTMEKRTSNTLISKQSNASLNISGTLLNATTGYTLQGLTVQVYFLEPTTSVGVTQQAETLLGTGNSTLGGIYQIVWVSSPAVSQKLCLLENCQDSQFILKVSGSRSQAPLLVTQPMSATTKSVSVNLIVPIPQEVVTKHNWNDIGQRLRTTRLTKLNDLIKQLVLLPSSQSLFKDWSLVLRQNVVMQLETAFLDPQGILSKIAPVPSWQQLSELNGLGTYEKSLGDSANQLEVQQAFTQLSEKVTQFSSISAVDWIIDSTLFTKSPSAAITANQDKYFITFPQRPVLVISNPELGYRNYLRTQWMSMITLAVAYVLTEEQAEQQLRNRLHQDFRTQDTSDVPANEILIPVLTEILTSASGGTFGFGVLSAQIPARGGASARQYLDTLIGLSGVSAKELTLRYRTDFTRPDTIMSSAAWENIHTLQAFLRDSFQSVVDLSHTDPDVLKQPIIPSVMQGKAPFFLEYGEWLLVQQPIPFANFVQIQDIFNIDISADSRRRVQNLANTSGPNQSFFQLCVGALVLQDQLVTAYQFLDHNEYKAALDIFEQLQTPLLDLLSSPVVSQVDVDGAFASRRAMSVESLDDLNKLLVYWHVRDDNVDPYTWDQWAQAQQTALVCSLVYLGVFTLPVVSAQASLALGDYPTAVREFGRSAFLLVGKATASWAQGYRDNYFLEYEGVWLDFRLYAAGNLPYTIDTETKLSGYPSFSDDDSLWWGADVISTPLDDFFSEGIHPFERQFFRLQMGAAMLEWADTLYRTDDDSNISRARELYKGVYYLHGALPPINPTWKGQKGPGRFFNGVINPESASQLARAELGFTQIEARLNFFGYSDDMVPILRYSTLKAAADGFASEAKTAEQDFLNFMGQMESATVENMKNAAMLQRANLQTKIADQQAGIAHDQINQAQILITQVNQQIQAVKQQIADHDSFFGQLGDYLGGVAGIVKGLPSYFTSGVEAGVKAEAGIGSSDTAGLLGLGAGASALAGFGAFIVVSYITLSSMADSQNQRQSQLVNLQNQSLPAAQAQLDISNRSVTIANLNMQIAEADAQLATQLLAFAQDRYLSVEFWSYMASMLKRILRQFLNLATRMGWLAQRALSYEQNTAINIILMDYFPARNQGTGGADRLQLDLAVLETQHLDGLREMIPVKYTVSLARDFPLQFAQLRTTGKCVFQTAEQSLQRAYPGTYAYRIIAVTPTLTQVAAYSPVRGLLSNAGISQISAGDGSKKLSVRPADALPISEFNLGTTDRQIWGLPGGTLMQFEGSGVDTMWTLEFPAAANPSGLNGVADVLITMDLRAQFGPGAYQAQLQQLPHSVTKFVLISALKQQISGLAELQGKPGKATIAFDLTTIDLPAQEQNRKVNNIAILVISGKNAASVTASVIAATSAQTIAVTFTNRVVFSNAPPITDAQSSVPPSPLNALAGATVDQTFSLQIDKSQNPGVDFSTIQDVLLGVDYTAAV